MRLPFQLAHLGAGRSLLEFGAKGLQRGLLTTHAAFHAAVVAIAHPARKSQPACAALHEQAKAHALHPAGHDKSV